MEIGIGIDWIMAELDIVVSISISTGIKSIGFSIFSTTIR
jgi:hypothetical protein